MSTRFNTAAVILAASFFIGLLAAHAQSPNQAPPLQSIGSPISGTHSNVQIKLGGIGINMNPVPVNITSLAVLGSPTQTTGRVTIGDLGFAPLGMPHEQLEVQGNLQLTGILKLDTDGNPATPPDAGAPGNVLERTLTSPPLPQSGEEIMSWEGRGWMTIMGGWSSDYSCTGASPRLCGAFGGAHPFREYSIHCLGMQPGYSVWVRVCRE